MSPTGLSEAQKRNRRVAFICAAVFAGMVGAAYASVPLYRAFCQATGFDGTVSKASVAPTKVLDRKLTIRFDANVRDMPWDFTAQQVSQDVRIGATGLAFFHVKNNSNRPITGRASYNVVPEQAAAYFHKLECFCFSDQTLQPGQAADFPVVYFVDPQYVNDPETKDGQEITLSYTFFQIANQPKTTQTAASALGGTGKGRL
ncbi:MAG: cytochrome c oxidase assembly protein [Ignavibacteriales bacterium]